LRRVLEKIVAEECWGRVLGGSVGEGVLWRSVAPKCCRQVLGKAVAEEFWRRVL